MSMLICVLAAQSGGILGPHKTRRVQNSTNYGALRHNYSIEMYDGDHLIVKRFVGTLCKPCRCPDYISHAQ